MGSQRSGTTILSMILDVHPEISIIEEDNCGFHFQGSHTLLLDFTKAKTYKSETSRYIGFKAPRDTHRVNELFSTIPNTKIIWISRCVEPVVSSMCHLKLDGKNTWAITHAPREIRKYLDIFSSDKKIEKHFSEIKNMPASRNKEISLATLCWLTKEKSKEYVKKHHDDSTHFVDYYDLISITEDTTKKICEFLGLKWSDVLLRHHEFNQGERIGGSYAEHPVATDNDDKWKSTLTDKDLAVINNILQSTFPLSRK